jgi:hypothetical protein
MKLELITLLTLVLDLFGLILISWYLYSIPEPVSFNGEITYDNLADLQIVADSINKISRNLKSIRKMRFGFIILVISLFIKIGIILYN